MVRLIFCFIINSGRILINQENWHYIIFDFHLFIPFKYTPTHCEENFEDTKKPSAYFICLVGTDSRGKPEKEHYLYDVATEMELQGFKVKFLSAKNIQEFYRKHHPDFNEEEVDIYEMTLFFVEMHKRSSFFFDEVPFIGKGGKYGWLH